MTKLTLSAARQQRGLTQEQLAALAGVDQTTISNYETAARGYRPRPATRRKIARALRVAERRLVFGTTETEAIR